MLPRRVRLSCDGQSTPAPNGQQKQSLLAAWLQHWPRKLHLTVTALLQPSRLTSRRERTMQCLGELLRQSLLNQSLCQLALSNAACHNTWFAIGVVSFVGACLSLVYRPGVPSVCCLVYAVLLLSRVLFRCFSIGLARLRYIGAWRAHGLFITREFRERPGEPIL